jgi:trehalose/maltose transport system permease protein
MLRQGYDLLETNMPALSSLAPARLSGLEQTKVRTAWLFLSPILIALALIALWPLLRTIFFSFTDANLADLSDFGFIGLDNYLHREDGRWVGLLADPAWWQSVRNTLLFTVLSVTLETIVGMVIALVMNQSFRGRGLVRAAVLIPWAVPTIVSATMWNWMLNDQNGIINDMLLHIGLLSEAKAWTSDHTLVMAAVVMVDVWKTAPFMALLILAALQMLPSDCYEAAKVDGIHPVKVFFKVTLPLIRPALMVAVIFRAMDALRVFDVIYVLTSNNTRTMSMSVFARQQLVDFQLVGYGSAASTLLFMTIGLCIAIYVTVGRVRFDGSDAS